MADKGSNSHQWRFNLPASADGWKTMGKSFRSAACIQKRKETIYQYASTDETLQHLFCFSCLSVSSRELRHTQTVSQNPAAFYRYASDMAIMMTTRNYTYPATRDRELVPLSRGRTVLADTLTTLRLALFYPKLEMGSTSVFSRWDQKWDFRSSKDSALLSAPPYLRGKDFLHTPRPPDL